MSSSPPRFLDRWPPSWMLYLAHPHPGLKWRPTNICSLEGKVNDAFAGRATSIAMMIIRLVIKQGLKAFKTGVIGGLSVYALLETRK